VFLARKPERHRKMRNSPEIETMLHARGFETVYPEDLDFDAQVRMMRGAEWVVGPEGSAMFLAFFARPGTRICILNHPFTLGMTVLTSLLEELQLDVCMFTGPALTENKALPHFIDYCIDAEALGRFLDAEAQA
jgi:capsular polysaccharide biosynthesis protein